MNLHGKSYEVVPQESQGEWPCVLVEARNQYGNVLYRAINLDYATLSELYREWEVLRTSSEFLIGGDCYSDLEDADLNNAIEWHEEAP